MTPGDFLRTVWPGAGTYCLATRWQPKDAPNKVWVHRTFDDIPAILNEVRNLGPQDIYFATHALKEHKVWNAEKLNYKTGEPGAYEVRTRRNVRAARCFFLDLDVGDAADKFPTQAFAGAELRRFCQITKLPKPLIVSSGNGLHIYWPLTDELESSEWRTHAEKLKHLARQHSFLVDPTRVSDTASVLRVPGTFNYKSDPPTEVSVLWEAGPFDTAAFLKLINNAIIEAGIEIKPMPNLQAAEDEWGSNTDREFNGPKTSLEALLKSCGQMRRMHSVKGAVREPEWYSGIIGVGRFLEDGHVKVQEMSSGYDGYDPAVVDAKIKQHEDYRNENGKPLGPTSCAKILEVSLGNEDICRECPFAGKVYGPLQAAGFNDTLPPPEVVELVGETPVTTTIVEAPEPFSRNKRGISILAKNADGDLDYSYIYDYDLYPIRRLSNPTMGTEQQLWHVTLPRGEAKDFLIDADTLYDTRKFVATVSNQGIYPNKGHVASLQEYMVAYISKLQQLVDAETQSNHLGWSDNHTKFIFPDKIMVNDGSVKPAQLSLGAQRTSAFVQKQGTLEKQVELLKFYNKPQYFPNQFMILAGLGSPVFHATGHHGIIINASGDAGASKSTTLYTTASIWGHPELYPMNGTNNGATVRGRNERVTVLANFPICVDEITHMPVKDAVDLAMSITQPGHRIRLQQDGVERASIGSYKSTIMLSTGNNSLHNMLSTDNAAGTAGSMRVFEIRFFETKVHQKHEADAFLHELKENYGHLGEVFIGYVMANYHAVVERIRQKTKEIDIILNIKASERFWSAAIATVLVTGEIALELNILSFDMEALKHWICNVQVPSMRGVVAEEYSDPMTIVGDYLETINSNMVVMEKDRVAGAVTLHVGRKPMGALLAHFDTDDRMLYVLKKGFKDYCTRIGANSRQILEDLHQLRDGARIIANPHVRRTLGAGTDYAKAQSWCFSINMAHKVVTGGTILKVIEGGKEKAAPEDAASPSSDKA